MKIGVFLVLFQNEPLEKALDYVKGIGAEAVEIGTGGYPGNAHLNPEEFLAKEDNIKRLKEAVASRGLEISGLSCHGNPVHPNKEIAEKHHRDFENTVL